MLLALDVASSICTIALFDPARGKMLAERVWRTRRRQTEETLPALADMLARAGADVDALRAVAVTTGPGSFTGVRIGISLVRGIALGLAQTPYLIGLPVLSMTAARFAPSAAVAGAVVWPLLQAGRGRFNWAVAPLDNPLWLPPAAAHRAGQAEALVAALRAEERPVWLVGELDDALRQAARSLPHVRCIDPAAELDCSGRWSAPNCRSLTTDHRPLTIGVCDPVGMAQTRGEGLARLAVRHWRANSPALTTPLQPLYLRPPR